MPKPYNVGIVGYGMSAKVFHIPFINASPNFTLHSIVQRTPKPNDSASTDHPNAKIYSSLDSLLADPSNNVDIVVLTTTPTTHHTLALLAINANKHILVEKPFTPTSTQAHELVTAAKEKNVLLTVYQNRRYDADFLTLRSLLDNGSLGRVSEFETHFDRHRPDLPAGESWKTKPEEYSAVFDLGTHLIDQIITIYGLPKQITGFVGTQREGNTSGVEDSFTALLHYHDGLLATVKAAVVSPETEQLRFWVRGVKGSYKKFHLDPQEDQLKAGKRPGDKEYGLEDESKDGILTRVVIGGNVKVEMESERMRNISTNGYTAFYEQLARALDQGDEALLPVRPQEAVDLIRLIELIRQSSKEGRTLEV